MNRQNDDQVTYLTAVAEAQSGNHEAAVRLFESVIERNWLALAELTISADEAEPSWDVFKVLEAYYHPSGTSPQFARFANESLASIDWQTAIATVFADEVFVLLLMLLRNQDQNMWQVISPHLQSSSKEIPDFAIAKPRYMAKIAFLFQAAGMQEQSHEWLEATVARLGRGPNCMCGDPKCDQGVSQWIQRS